MRNRNEPRYLPICFAQLYAVTCIFENSRSGREMEWEHGGKRSKSKNFWHTLGGNEAVLCPWMLNNLSSPKIQFAPFKQRQDSKTSTVSDPKPEERKQEIVKCSGCRNLPFPYKSCSNKKDKKKFI